MWKNQKFHGIQGKACVQTRQQKQQFLYSSHINGAQLFWDTLYENLDMLHLVPIKDRFCNTIAAVSLIDTSIQIN